MAPHAGAQATGPGTARVYPSIQVQEHRRTGGNLQGLSKLLFNTGILSPLPTAHGPKQVISEPNIALPLEGPWERRRSINTAYHSELRRFED